MFIIANFSHTEFLKIHQNQQRANPDPDSQPWPYSDHLYSTFHSINHSSLLRSSTQQLFVYAAYHLQTVTIKKDHPT
jgi:hypothetical protein